ncbi:MAG: hypothetical protein ACR2QC_04705 [Gammaproteobacteria bacterium]
MAVLFVFADNTEFGGIRKDKKPPFRRKPESLSHSCESRNLRAERRKLSPKANPPFALARKEIPAFAGMAVFFVFADNTKFGGIRKYKIRHSGESLSSRTRGPESHP